MVWKETDMVLYKEPKISISNFSKMLRVVLLLNTINNAVLSVMSSGKQTRSSSRIRLSKLNVFSYA